MRARNIKPGFFKNEDLADIDPLGRILFAGLWCMADREGRMEDRPKRIKVEILPYDNCNIDKLLNALQDKNFIIRYKENGSKYIQILNFLKHQSPHVKEQESTIPAPDLHQTCMVQAPESHRCCPSDSLIPDSSTDCGLLIADSGPSAEPLVTSVYSCQYFDVSEQLFLELQDEYPGLTSDQLLDEIKKMGYWIDDNKGKRKFDAKGRVKNFRLGLANWLKHVETSPENGKKSTRYDGLAKWAARQGDL